MTGRVYHAQLHVDVPSEEPTLEGDYSNRGCLAHLLTGLIVGAVGYISGQGLEHVIRLAPHVYLGPLVISTRLLKYVIVTPALAILVWKAYRPYVRWLVRIGWLREPAPRRDRGEEP